ncbi:TatD family hydrolase [Acidithiobacillus sp. M4-SHS-6]|uniref:TatD family hydrolase n=1 Tax=Acidithiobacillus sp. M4-SHS-6 TaxID=3383024 RepID=UPI0039BDDCFC
MRFPELIDSHCHLDDAAFDPDRQEVIQRAQAAGVHKMVVPAYSPSFWPRLQQLCAQNTMLYPAYGVHPLYLNACASGWLDALPVLLEQAVALGEIGLDLSENAPDHGAQVACLKSQLQLALALNLPVILHARRTLEELILILRGFPGLRGVVHSFSGSLVQAQRLMDSGFYLGLGAAFTHPRALRLQATIRSLPLDRVLIETDAPWQPGGSFRGQRNEPAFLVETVRALAHLREIPFPALAERLTRNTLAFFRFQENA